MVLYDRTEAATFEEIDRWDDGVGWIAHPDETARRASHAIRGSDGVWLVDPLDAPGVADLIADLWEVVGVVVLFNWHARDADRFARRYGVPVSVPEWIDRVEARTDAPVRRVSGDLGGSGFELRRWTPVPGWREAFAYRESDGTLYVPESAATAAPYIVGDERIGLDVSQRVRPPRDRLGALAPDRILFGHGEGAFDDAARALEGALAGARRRFPRALLENGPTQLRSLVAAVRD